MHSFRELKARWALRNWRSPTGIMVFGVGWTVTLRVEQISLLLPERIPELYQSLYQAGGVFTPPPEGGGVLNSTRFGPKGPVRPSNECPATNKAKQMMRPSRHTS